MTPRPQSDRQKEWRDRTATGHTSLRITRATAAKLRELQQLVQPFEARGIDELLYQLIDVEIQRRRGAP